MGRALELIESYLQGRKQRVRIGNAGSFELDVQNRVPQGSVLGPLFFVFFINDLPQRVISDCYGYVDDYKVFGTNNITMQIDAANIWKWCTENLMKLNVSKCKALCIKGETKVTLNGWELGKSEKEKDLGIMIHKDRNWTANANRRCEKALKAFFTIKRNFASLASQEKPILELYRTNYLIRVSSLETKQTRSEKN